MKLSKLTKFSLLPRESKTFHCFLGVKFAGKVEYRITLWQGFSSRRKNQHIIRKGGSWLQCITKSVCSSRHGYRANAKDTDMGLRVLMDCK